MIDDKKIEEAAQEAADLYEQDLPIMSYNEDTEVDGQHHFCQEFGAKLFKDGAKWAINSVSDLQHLLFGLKLKSENGGVDMTKRIVELSNEELELLITSLHCLDEGNYNFHTQTYTPWNEAKEIKATLRVKLIRAQLNT